MGENNKEDVVEMFVKFWAPYAVQMAAKDIDVIEQVPGWLPKIDGMTVEQVSPYEVPLHRVPSARMSDIKRRVSRCLKPRGIKELWYNNSTNMKGDIIMLTDGGQP